MTKFNTPEQFAAINKAGIEAITTLSNGVFARAERFTALNLNTARAILEDSIASTRNLSAINKPEDFAALQATLAQPMIDKAMAYGRGVYQISTEAQQEVAQLIEAQMTEINKNINVALDQAARSAPAGSEPVFTAIRSALAAGTSAYDKASRTAKEFAETAEGNLAAATEATLKVVSSNPRKAA